VRLAGQQTPDSEPRTTDDLRWDNDDSVEESSERHEEPTMAFLGVRLRQRGEMGSERANQVLSDQAKLAMTIEAQLPKIVLIEGSARAKQKRRRSPPPRRWASGTVASASVGAVAVSIL